MRWIALLLASLFAFSNLQAFDEEFATDEEMLTLDSEIEAILEEEGFDEMSIQTNFEKVEVEEPANESIGLEVDRIAAEDEPMVVQAPPILDAIKEETNKAIDAIEINLRQVFSGSPIIYSILFFLSTVSICVWLYSMLTIRSVEFLPPKLIKDLRTKLVSNQFDEALDLCVKQKHFFCKMLASGILARRHGLNVMVDTMKSEGKRSTVAFWQRINILNEIAVIAPMLGLLGTVLGMFYAFYDLNRSVESVSLLFDGLGISVGTTVAGLVVAILAMILYSVAKYRLVRILANVENEAQTFAALIDTRAPTYLEK
ncbi:MAG: MotA/TolQ/ExbB proton channel family protein [Simkaniaceae bacterium]|nr:MotA/TolQ/ExbB proton channel family protein [Candidatus Sacchlamyda saccharinae]